MRISDWSSDVCSSDLLTQQRAVRGAGNSGKVVEADHDSTDAGVDGRLEGRQHDVVHAVGAGVDGVVVAPRFRKAIAGEVLGCSHHRSGAGKIVTWIALDNGKGEGGTEKRESGRAHV